MEGYCTVNSDSSIKGNVAGYAFWIVSDGIVVKGYGRFKGEISDSNEAEMKGVINALEVSKRCNLMGKIVVVNVDNSTTRDCINGKITSIRNETLEGVREILCSRLKEFTKTYAKEIKGHSNKRSARHHVNRWCDDYSRKGRNLPENSPPQLFITYICGNS